MKQVFRICALVLVCSCVSSSDPINYRARYGFRTLETLETELSVGSIESLEGMVVSILDTIAVTHGLTNSSESGNNVVRRYSSTTSPLSVHRVNLRFEKVKNEYFITISALAGGGDTDLREIKLAKKIEADIVAQISQILGKETIVLKKRHLFGFSEEELNSK